MARAERQKNPMRLQSDIDKSFKGIKKSLNSLLLLQGMQVVMFTLTMALIVRELL